MPGCRRWGGVRGGRGEPTVTSDVVERARKGERAALADLWESLQPALLRYLWSLGVDGAEDVASVVWIELAGSLARLADDDPETLRRMLFTIARRRMIDEYRRRTRRPEVPVSEMFDAEARPEENLGAALELLRQLPPSQAEVVALRVIVGMSAQEVGEVTGQTAAAVRVMAHRGLAALRELLLQQSGHDADEAVGRMTQQLQPHVTDPGAGSKIRGL